MPTMTRKANDNDSADVSMLSEPQVIQCFDSFEHARDRLRVAHEHGGTWLECLDCGAQWGVHEAPGSVHGLDFEEVSEGDGWCDGGGEEDVEGEES
jgi:hypothetical protein